MVCGRVQTAGAAATEMVWKKRPSSACRDVVATCSAPRLLFPPLAVRVLVCAAGGTPEYKRKRNADRTSRKKGQGSEGRERAQAEGRVGMMLLDSGGDGSDDGCEKKGSLCLPVGSVTGCRFGGCDGNKSMKTWTGETRS